MGADTKRLQRVLNQEGFGPLAVDGGRGPLTREALRKWSERAHAQPQGIDASSYQPSIDWGVVRGAGVSFVAIRSGASTSRDKLFSEHWKGAKSAGLLRAAYHYFAPWRNPIEQARACFAAQAGDVGELPPVLDVEALAPRSRAGQAPPVPVTSQQLTDRAGMALEELARLSGRRPILYTYAAFARAHKLGELFGEYPLWLADYREGPPELLGGYRSYQFHQYAGDAGRQIGVKGPCDMDRFNGTLVELKQL